jgi:hypothetical protein
MADLDDAFVAEQIRPIVAARDAAFQVVGCLKGIDRIRGFRRLSLHASWEWVNLDALPERLSEAERLIRPLRVDYTAATKGTTRLGVDSAKYWHELVLVIGRRIIKALVLTTGKQKRRLGAVLEAQRDPASVSFDFASCEEAHAMAVDVLSSVPFPSSADLDELWCELDREASDVVRYRAGELGRASQIEDKPEGSPTAPNSNSSEQKQRKRQRDPVQGLLDETALKVIQIAESDLSLEERLTAISALDCRFWGKGSPELGDLLSVSDGRIRQTNWWKNQRPRHLEADAVDMPDVDDF